MDFEKIYPDTYDDILSDREQEDVIDTLAEMTEECMKLLDNPYFKNDDERYAKYDERWDEIEDYVEYLEGKGVFPSYNDFGDGQWHLITEDLFDAYMNKYYS